MHAKESAANVRKYLQLVYHLPLKLRLFCTLLCGPSVTLAPPALFSLPSCICK